MREESSTRKRPIREVSRIQRDKERNPRSVDKRTKAKGNGEHDEFCCYFLLLSCVKIKCVTQDCL